MKAPSWQILVVILLGGGLFFAGSADATALDGEIIATTYLFPNTGVIFAGPVNTTVPGTISNFAGFADITFSANTILITADRNAAVNNVAFDGFEFSDTNPVFGTVALDASSTYAGFDATRISFNANQIFVNVEDLAGLKGQTILLDINTTSSTPEPATLLLLGTGILGLVRSKKKA